MIFINPFNCCTFAIEKNQDLNLIHKTFFKPIN